MLSDLIKDSCRRFGLDFVLVNAIISTESGFNPHVIRYEPNYKYLYKVFECSNIVGCTFETMEIMQKTSWGLGQLMGACFYEMGGKNWATILFDPEINIHFTCEYLKNIIEKNNLSDARDIYTVYNAGSIRRMKNGELVNQKNVDRFMAIYKTVSRI